MLESKLTVVDKFWLRSIMGRTRAGGSIPTIYLGV